MTMHRHFQRQRGFSLRENRLLHNVASIEVLSEQVISLLRDAPADAPEQLKQLLQKVMAQGETAEFGNAFKIKFDRLDAEVRTLISNNLKNLDVTVLRSTVAAQLSTLSTAVESGVQPGAGQERGLLGRAVDRSQKFFSDSWNGAEKWWEERS